MRKAISNELMRVAISGSPTRRQPHLVERLQIASSESRLQLRVDAARDSTDTAPGRRCRGTARPGKRVGKKPLPQLELPPLGPLVPELKTTKPGQILRFAPQAVGDPRAHARPAELLASRCSSRSGRGVVEGVGDHRLDDRQSSATLARCGSISDSSAPLWPCRANLNRGPKQVGIRIDEGGPIALEQFRRRQLCRRSLANCGLLSNSSRWLGRTGHEQKDDALRFGRKGGGLRSQRIDRTAGCRRAQTRPSSTRPATIAPSPTPHCCRNQRRRHCVGRSCGTNGPGSSRLFLRNRLVQIQEHPRNGSPAGKFVDRRALGQRGSRPAARHSERQRTRFVRAKVLSFLLEKHQEGGGLIRARRARQAAAESIRQSFVLVANRPSTRFLMPMPEHIPGTAARLGWSALAAACWSARGARREASPLGASNVCNAGYGTERKRNV